MKKKSTFGPRHQRPENDPGAVFLLWQGHAVVLLAASGAKYGADTQGGQLVFWSKGDEAMFTLPDQPALNCQLDE